MADIEEAEALAPHTFAVTRTLQVKGSPAIVPNSGGSLHGRRPGLPVDARARDALAIPAFYRGVRWLSETLGCLPKRINQAVVDPTGATRRKRVNHPATPLLSQTPNGLVNAAYLWETCYGHATMYGNGYVWIERRLGTVVGLHSLHALLVLPFRSGGRQFYAVRDWSGRPVLDVNTGAPLAIPSADMIHIRNFSEDGETGISVLDILADNLGLARKLDEFLITYFENGSAVNIVVEADKGLTRADVDTLRHGINEQNVGLDNAHNVMVLSGGSAKTLTPPIKDFATDILKTASVDDIARALGVDPTILYNLARATWANLEQLGNAVITYSLGSWVRKGELECNSKVLTAAERASGFYTKFQVEHLSRGGFEDRVKAGAQAIQNGLLSPNEWREMESLDARDGGDVYYSPPNCLPQGTSGNVDPDTDDDDTSDPDTQPAPAASLDPAATVADATPLVAADGEVVASPVLQVSRSDEYRRTFGRFLEDIVARVRRKQEKAFARPREDADEWLKTFSAEQGVYLAEALNPFVETVFRDGGDRAIVAQAITEEYTAAVSGLGVNADPDEVVEAVLRRIK